MINKKKTNLIRSPKYRNEKASVFSYRSSSSRAQSPSQEHVAQAKQEDKSRFRHAPTYIALIAILVSCFYASLLSTSNPKVIQLTTNSSSILRSDQEYEKGVSDILSNSVWSRSKLTIDTDDVANQIKEKFTEVGAATVSLPLIGRRPVIQISPAVPLLQVTTGSRSYAVSEEGRALINTSELSDDAINSLIKVNDALDIEFKAGDYVLPKNTVSFIKEVQRQLEQNNQRIESITLPAIANEVHVKVEGQPYIIKFNLQADARQQIGSYLAVIESLKNGGQAQPKEQIDVRVDGRVYYK